MIGLVNKLVGRDCNTRGSLSFVLLQLFDVTFQDHSCWLQQELGNARNLVNVWCLCLRET